MQRKSWFRVVLMAALIVALGVPSSAWTALAQDAQGPQTPPPSEQPEPPKPPTGVAPPAPKPQAPPPVSISVQSNLVNVDAVVTDNDGNLVTGLKRDNFRILDEGQPQQISNFAPSDAPITIVMLVEFSAAMGGYFGYKAQYWADGFLQQLQPQDWVALKTFDLRTTLQVDFTRDKRQVDDSLRTLGFPGFHESNLFDAIYETVDQLRDVKGKKSILVLATGYDTFSKHTLDQILHRLKETDVAIFCVGMGEEIDLSPNGGGVGYAQAQNQLNTFARLTGGYAWFPRFTGEMNGIFSTVAEFLRNQYTLGFSPTTPQDGRYHKLIVQVVDDQGNPLELANKKGKKKKAIVDAREGYTAPNAPAGN
ncbi:MAG TPA: VWA domain-containing protein [Candidatus Acidoferrales bacterium]|jgi:VWFA-related protein|nr:VWA domain-containing protein [Candidatus Acidoferrales bacterium]